MTSDIIHAQPGGVEHETWRILRPGSLKGNTRHGICWPLNCLGSCPGSGSVLAERVCPCSCKLNHPLALAIPFWFPLGKQWQQVVLAPKANHLWTPHHHPAYPPVRSSGRGSFWGAARGMELETHGLGSHIYGVDHGDV